MLLQTEISKNEADSESRTGKNLEALKVLSDTESRMQLRVEGGFTNSQLGGGKR